MSSRAELDADYDTSLQAFRATVTIYTAACLKYRAREIDDDQFLRVRSTFDAAKLAMDAAETAYIDAVNRLGS